eukprot:4022939-Prymnesium_polylepis.2
MQSCLRRQPDATDRRNAWSTRAVSSTSRASDASLTCSPGMHMRLRQPSLEPHCSGTRWML